MHVCVSVARDTTHYASLRSDDCTGSFCFCGLTADFTLSAHPSATISSLIVRYASHTRGREKAS